LNIKNLKINAMKKLTKLRFVAALLVVTGIIFILNGCKKADLESHTLSTDDATAIAKMKANIAGEIEKLGGIPQIFTRNQKVTTQWVDKNRNPVNPKQLQGNNFTSACDYDYPTYTSLVQYSRVYRCESSTNGGPGYALQFEYNLTWNTNIVHVNPYSLAETTGYIEVYDPSYNLVQIITLNTANSEVYITETGAAGGGYYNFKVKFITTDFVNDLLPAYIINGDFGTYTIKLGATLVTDCQSGGEAYALYILPVATHGFTDASGYNPCERNEKAFLSWGMGGSFTNRLVAIGYDPLSLSCGYGGSFVRPDLQQVQYSIDNGATWVDFTNDITASGLPIGSTNYIRKDDFARSPTLSANTNYDVIIRYRNWKYVLTNPSGWPVPDFNDDCFSSGDNPGSNTSSSLYSTYAYEFFPNVSW
jgi:hypothetical protein